MDVITLSAWAGLALAALVGGRRRIGFRWILYGLFVLGTATGAALGLVFRLAGVGLDLSPLLSGDHLASFTALALAAFAALCAPAVMPPPPPNATEGHRLGRALVVFALFAWIGLWSLVALFCLGVLVRAPGLAVILGVGGLVLAGRFLADGLVLLADFTAPAAPAEPRTRWQALVAAWRAAPDPRLGGWSDAWEMVSPGEEEEPVGVAPDESPVAALVSGVVLAAVLGGLLLTGHTVAAMALPRLPTAEDGEALRFAALSAGRMNVCALAEDGGAYCAGPNRSGQLGIGRIGGSSAFARVASDRRFVEVVTAENYGCGVTPEGPVLCWGVHPGRDFSVGPSAEPEPVPALDGLAALALGDRWLCGRERRADPGPSTEPRSWRCWGAGTAPWEGRVRPRQEAADMPPPPVDTVVAGGGGACGLDPSGGLHCWPRPAGASAWSAEAPLVRIALSSIHGCGVDERGQAWCWGGNGAGELGDGTTERRELPVPVSQGDVRFAAIEVGSNHTCALETDGRAWCWGANADGRLGTGDREPRSVPAPVATEDRFRSLVLGTASTCGVTTDGGLRCWGGGRAGRGSRPLVPPFLGDAAR